METAVHVRELLARGEGVSVECKGAQRGVPASLWETYSAFANTYGGTILLGIEEGKDEAGCPSGFKATGIDNPERMRKDLWNTLNNKEKISANLLSDGDIQTIRVDGKDIIAISVPQADYAVRPIYINNNLTRGTYRRNNDGDYHCTEQELRLMIRDTNEAGNDRLFLEHYTMDDIDLQSLAQYRRMFMTDNPEHIWNGLDDKKFLEQLGGYTKNRETGAEGLTMAGLLMFGKGLPIRERFDNLRMDYVDKSGLVGEQRYSDRLTYDGTWENNLFNFVRLVLPRLTKGLPRPFNMEGVRRIDDTLQHKAVREALTNAIIHADFMLNGVLRVEKYDDRLVFTNPGLLKLPLSQIYLGGESKARNQRVQAMFRMIGFGENLGSGFPIIITAWREKNWLEPELTEDTKLLQVKLTLRIKDFDSKTEKSSEKSSEKELGKSSEKNIRLSTRKIIGIIVSNPKVSAGEIASMLGISARAVEKQIAKLRALNILVREGADRGGRWRIMSPLQK